MRRALRCVTRSTHSAAIKKHRQRCSASDCQMGQKSKRARRPLHRSRLAKWNGAAELRAGEPLQLRSVVRPSRIMSRCQSHHHMRTDRSPTHKTQARLLRTGLGRGQPVDGQRPVLTHQTSIMRSMQRCLIQQRRRPAQSGFSGLLQPQPQAPLPSRR